MIRSVLVVGAGSAGLMAAIALKRKIPQLTVRVLRDPDTPVIGVGESTTPNVPAFLFDFLRLNHRHFYNTTKATWKIGIHFLWGPRPSFNYGFTPQLDIRWSDLGDPRRLVTTLFQSGIENPWVTSGCCNHCGAALAAVS